MRSSTVRVRRLVLVLVLLLAGCGGSEERGRDTGQRTGAERYESKPIGRAEAERYASVELPSKLSDLEARRFPGPLDDSIALRFTIPRSELAGLRSILSQPLEEGRMTVPDRPSLGWRTEDSKRFLGASDLVDGVGRQVLVDLDDPGRPVVYVVAGTAA